MAVLFTSRPPSPGRGAAWEPFPMARIRVTWTECLLVGVLLFGLAGTGGVLLLLAGLIRLIRSDEGLWEGLDLTVVAFAATAASLARRGRLAADRCDDALVPETRGLGGLRCGRRGSPALLVPRLRGSSGPRSGPPRPIGLQHGLRRDLHDLVDDNFEPRARWLDQRAARCHAWLPGEADQTALRSLALEGAGDGGLSLGHLLKSRDAPR